MVEASPAPIAPTPAPEAPPVDDLSYLYRQRPELVPAAEPVAPAPPEPASVEAAVAAATTLRARLVGDKAWGRSYLDGDVAKQNQMKALDRLRTAPPSD
jgi:hypothetical protein